MPKELTPEGSLTPPEISTMEEYNEKAEQIIDRWSKGDRKDSDAPSKAISEFDNLLPNGRVLEIGTGGRGHTARWFVNNGCDYIGTDISSGMLEQARKNNPGVRLEQISVYDLDFNEPFDGFWCSSVLLHIPKNRINEALSAIHHNMKQGAVGFISIKEGDHEVMEVDGRFHAYWLDKDFSERLNSNGYKVLERESSLGRKRNQVADILGTNK